MNKILLAILILLIVLLIAQETSICLSEENKIEKRFYVVCPKELDRVSITLEDDYETVLYSSKQISWRYKIDCLIKRLVVSHDGSYMIALDEKDRLHFLNRQGERLGKANFKELAEEEIPYREYLGTCSICGAYFEINTILSGALHYLGVTKEGIAIVCFLYYGECEVTYCSCLKYPPEDYYLRAEKILFFDKSGNLLWKYESGVEKRWYPYSEAELLPTVRFAPFASCPAVFINNRVFFPDNQTVKSLPIAVDSKVSLDGNLIAWESNDYENEIFKLCVYDRISEKYWETGFDYMVERVAVSPNSETISALVQTRGGDLYLHIFDRFGTKLREKRVFPCEEKFYDPVVGEVKITLRTKPEKLAMFNSSLVALAVPDYYVSSIGIYSEGVKAEPFIWKEECRMLGYALAFDAARPWSFSLSGRLRYGYLDSEGHLHIIESIETPPVECLAQISTYELICKSFLRIDCKYEVPFFYRSPIIDLAFIRIGFPLGFPIKVWGKVNPPVQVNLTIEIHWTWRDYSKEYVIPIQTNKDGTFYFELDGLLPADQVEYGKWRVDANFYGNDNFLSTYRIVEFEISGVGGVVKTFLVIFGILISLVVFKKILSRVRSKTKHR